MMCQPKIIAIDGPAAAGKSTLGIRLAEDLSFLYFDTGVMYRALAWVAILRGVPFDHETQITALADHLQIDVRPPSVPDGRSSDVLVDGQDLSWEIRKPEVDASVSIVAAYPGVRFALTEKQRQIGLRGHVVMVGRDIGTVVLPEADLKVYLDASVAERARRRFDELRSRGEQASYEMILQSMQRRDEIDTTRAVAPLRPAEDAVIFSSDGKDEEEVFKQIRQLCDQC
jgi:cytidylate kinase